MTILTGLHVAAGTFALVAGSVSLSVTKGSRWHRLSGHLFFVLMLLMAASAAYLAFHRSEPENLVVGSLTFYLVVTAWTTVHGSGNRRRVDVAMFGLALSIVVISAVFGIEALNSESGLKDGIRASNFFLLSGLTGLFVLSDLRLLLQGGVFGKRRLVRHLWRMSLAMFIATLSFFFGQARFLPTIIVETFLNLAPIAFIFFITLYWLIRLGAGRFDRAFIVRNSARSDL